MLRKARVQGVRFTPCLIADLHTERKKTQTKAINQQDLLL
jgi:hypothetical protein